MKLSISEVLRDPHLVSYSFELPILGKVSLRPLKADDVDGLAIFLAELSPATRQFKYFPSYDIATASSLCAEIGRPDKLLFVVELSPSDRIIGLIEFSFEISEDDLQRFEGHGAPLEANTDCRFGPCLADEVQNTGVGSTIFPALIDIAKKFGKKRMILWGGVFGDNLRAIRFYEKHGFRLIGTSTGQDERQSLDMLLELEE